MSAKRPARRISAKALAAAEAEFPSQRYFQIHFQHLQQMIEELRQLQQETAHQLAELRRAVQEAQAPGYAVQPIPRQTEPPRRAKPFASNRGGD